MALAVVGVGVLVTRHASAQAASVFKVKEGTRVEEPDKEACIEALQFGINQIVGDDRNRYIYFYKSALFYIGFTGAGMVCIKLGDL